MALFRNSGVNRRNFLCGIQEDASAQFLDFLELAKNCTFLDRKLIRTPNESVNGLVRFYSAVSLQTTGNICEAVAGNYLSRFPTVLSIISTARITI